MTNLTTDGPLCSPPSHQPMNHHSEIPLQPRQPGRSSIVRTIAGALLSAWLAGALHATDPSPLAKSLGDLSLEELMNETVTSVSKKEQKLNDAAAAIFVLSNDDLRRSGATTLADALRLVPGMDVGSINASQTAVSARGFNGSFANKLLVLVDGRAVYSPLFAGVFWDLQQSTLEDVDRVEVIRGPGATLWGANAVNGVINVVTRSARDTLGGLLYGGGGEVHTATGGVRYGGRLDDHTYYRVYAGGQSHADFPLASGQPAGDAWSERHGGFRVDGYHDDGTHLTWQADLTTTDLDHHTSDAYNGNTLGRWTRTWSANSATEAQVYYDRTHRNDSLLAANTVDTWDVALQHSFAWGDRHEVIGGLGYRFITGRVAPTGPAILVRQPDFTLRIYSAFVQDEIKLVPDKLVLTLGSKIEHNDYTGVELQPSLSLVFKLAANQTLWTAVSRAVRTPSLPEGRNVVAVIYGAPFVGPDGGVYLPTLTGNPDLSSEKLWAYELGWRIQPTPRVNVDLTVFYNDYRTLNAPGDVPHFVPALPFGIAELPWTNDMSGRTHGGEGSVTVSPTNAWRLTAAYSLLVAKIRGPAFYAAAAEASSPRHQFSLRSAYDFNPRCSVDGQFRSVGAIQGVPAYATADLRLSYRPTDRVELSLAGQNLLEAQHPEQAAAPLTLTAEVPREFFGKVTWRF